LTNRHRLGLLTKDHLLMLLVLHLLVRCNRYRFGEQL
jgi:hypothetical protein